MRWIDRNQPLDAEWPESLQRQLTTKFHANAAPSPIPDSDPGISAGFSAELGSFSAFKRQDHGSKDSLASHVVALACTARRCPESQAPTEKEQTRRGPLSRHGSCPPLHPPSRRPCFLSSLDNVLTIVVVDAAGDHHTRLNPTLAAIASSHRLRPKGLIFPQVLTTDSAYPSARFPPFQPVTQGVATENRERWRHHLRRGIQYDG